MKIENQAISGKCGVALIIWGWSHWDETPEQGSACFGNLPATGCPTRPRNHTAEDSFQPFTGTPWPRIQFTLL